MHSLFFHQLKVCEFSLEFHGNIQYYNQHSHMAQWQDNQFKLSRDTFPLETILSVVDFGKIYTLQWQNDLGGYRSPPTSSTSSKTIILVWHIFHNFSSPKLPGPF